jgi:hypothetical protein
MDAEIVTAEPCCGVECIILVAKEGGATEICRDLLRSW